MMKHVQGKKNSFPSRFNRQKSLIKLLNVGKSSGSQLALVNQRTIFIKNICKAINCTKLDKNEKSERLMSGITAILQV